MKFLSAIVSIILMFSVLNEVDAQSLQNFAATTIKSFKAYKVGDEISNPIIELGSTDLLRFEFDDISEEVQTFDYTILHCDPWWNQSELMFEEFSDGFSFNSIDDYRSSQGTITLYSHYTLDLPNQNVNPKISGNYILRVVDSYDHSRVVIQQQFTVVEPNVTINARVLQPFSPKLKNSSQQLNLEVNYLSLGNIDPFSQIVTTITQNNQTYNAKVAVSPVFQGSGVVRYSAPDSLVFGGGYEYRNLVYRSSSYQSNQIQNVAYYGGEFHLNLLPDLSNRQLNYSQAKDINGKYVIKRDDCLDSNNEGEYLWFYFTLESPTELDADVYLYGEFTNWSISPAYKLKYSYASKAYETRILLKQGIYNYRYVAVDRNSQLASHSYFEGDYFATENTYQIYVHHKPFGGRYWKLVGYKEVSNIH